MRAPQEPTVEPLAHQCLRVHKRAATSGDQEGGRRKHGDREGLQSEAAERELQAVVAAGLGLDLSLSFESSCLAHRWCDVGNVLLYFSKVQFIQGV